MLEAYERLCDVRSPQAASFPLRLTLMRLPWPLRPFHRFFAGRLSFYWRESVELQPSEFFDCLLCCISLGNQFIQCLAFLGDDIRWCSAYKRFV